MIVLICFDHESEFWMPMPLELAAWVMLVNQRVELADLMEKKINPPFMALDEGDEFQLEHEDYGWKRWTKLDTDYASAFRQTANGRQHNVFAKFEPEMRVWKVEQ